MLEIEPSAPPERSSVFTRVAVTPCSLTLPLPPHCHDPVPWQ